MQSGFKFLLVSATLSALSSSAFATLSFPLYPMDETTVATITNVSNPSPFEILPTTPPTYQFTVATPLLCANTIAPIAISAQISTVYGSFVFGATAGSPAISATAEGISQLTYNTGTPQYFSFDGDTTLVCYATDASGVRKVTRDLFLDGFDPVGFDSQVALHVAQLPTTDSGPNSYYKYYIDVTIPAVTNAENFVIEEGFDTSVFIVSPTIANPSPGGWCQAASTSSTDCSPTALGNLNNSISLTAGQSAQQIRFIAYRQLNNGVVSVPNNGNAVALAALFSPNDLLENKLDNNVAAGFGAVSDFPPSIDTTATAPVLLTGLSECNGDGSDCTLNNISFTLNDDTAESIGHLLNATVNLYLDSLTAIPVVPDCGSGMPQVPPVSRTCTFAIDLSAAGLNLPDFATDTINGTYAPGVSANVQIVATDPIGQSTTITVPLHVASSKNNPPTATVSGVAVPDPMNNSMPTLTCSLATPGSAACNGELTAFIAGVAPGPVGAVDELAAQTAQFVVDNSSGLGGNIACPPDEGSASIFTALHGGGGPILSPSAPASSYDLDYILNGSTGSATCIVNIQDAEAGGFPNGETAQNLILQFRIVVTP